MPEQQQKDPTSLDEALANFKAATDEALRAREAARKARDARTKLDRLTGYAMIIVGVGGTILAMAIRPEIILKPKFADVASTESVTQLQQRFGTLEANYASLIKVPKVDVEASDLARREEALDVRLTRLETAIARNPERALAIPLLRKDVDVSTGRIDEIRQDVQALSSDLAVIRGLLLTGMGAVLLFGLSLVARNFLKGKGATE